MSKIGKAKASRFMELEIFGSRRKLETLYSSIKLDQIPAEINSAMDQAEHEVMDTYKECFTKLSRVGTAMTRGATNEAMQDAEHLKKFLLNLDESRNRVKGIFNEATVKAKQIKPLSPELIKIIKKEEKKAIKFLDDLEQFFENELK